MVFPRGLCVVLTIWMVCSRPSAPLRTGSLHPESWWAAKEFSDVLANEAKLRAAGDLARLEKLYRAAYGAARRLGNPLTQLHYLVRLGNTHFLRFRYTDALAEYLQAKNMAQSIGDWDDLELINQNLSSLYQQLWDEESAMGAAEEARTAATRSGPTPYLANLFLTLARFHAGRTDPEAAALYMEGIEAARQQLDAGQEAQGWDLLGEDRQAHGDLDGADRALVEAFRLRVLHRRQDLRFSYRRLGALRLAQALADPDGHLRAQRLEEAFHLTHQALSAAQDAKSVLGSWLLLHQLGKIQEAQGHTALALANFGAAVDQAALWYRTLPASDSSLVGANAALQHQVFDSFVEAAARRAIRYKDFRLAGESFMAEELNRASSLRETQALAPVWRSKLPSRYWEDLNLLRMEDANVLRGVGDAARAERLRLEISEMEAIAGIGFSLSKSENFRSLNSLSHFQEGLKQSELLLSFHLGPRESFLWAVSRSTVRLYRLEAEGRIVEQVREFREAVRESRPQSGEGGSGDPQSNAVERLGAELYSSLFGQLSGAEVALPSWLVAVEGPLFEIPFAALVRNRVHVEPGRTETDRMEAGRGERDHVKAEYLVERNSVQIVPGAMSLRSASDKPGASGRMVAVGDPVYNTADPRWRSGGRQVLSGGALWKRWWGQWKFGGGTGEGSGQLNRLVGSGREVAESVRVWGNTSAGVVLTGTASGRQQFLDALSPVPAVIHMATHVVSLPQRPEQAFLAFSADSEGRPELLATSDIAKLNVPGALVVMTGCATATGDARGDAGLLGLTRAWLVAGASATIATAWPVTDSNGELLPAFYRYWKTTSTAEALRRSQVEMIRSGGWRSAPSYWAAYQVTGGER